MWGSEAGWAEEREREGLGVRVAKEEGRMKRDGDSERIGASSSLLTWIRENSSTGEEGDDARADDEAEENVNEEEVCSFCSTPMCSASSFSLSSSLEVSFCCFSEEKSCFFRKDESVAIGNRLSSFVGSSALNDDSSGSC